MNATRRTARRVAPVHREDLLGLPYPITLIDGAIEE